MGSATSISNLEVAQPLGPQWVKESRESYCIVLRNIETGQQAEQYVVSSNQEIPAQFERYEYRLQQNENLVSTWAVQEASSEGVCNGYSKLMVINERIPLRLSQVTNLNFQDSLAVIYSALIGFQAIHNVQGYVSVTDEMIGFTPDYRVKVWLNENFSQNYPILPNRMINQQYSASAMIEELIVLVESHSAESLLPDFRNYFYGRFSPTGNFANALAIVRDYAQINGLSITNRVTFTQGAPRQVVTGQYTTSYIYPEAQPQLSLVRSSIIQQGQSTITTIQQPAIVNYIQEPIIQQQLIHVNQPAIINQAPIIQQSLIRQSVIPHTSFVQAPISYPIQPRVIASPPALINHRSLAQSTHFGIPSRVITQNVQARNVVSHNPQLSNINQTRFTSPSIQPFSQVRKNIETINIKPVSLAARQITPPKVIQKIQNQTPTRNQSPTRIVQTDQLQKGANLIQAQRYISSLNQGSVRVSPQRIQVNQIKPTTAGPSPVVKIENLFENKIESQGRIQGQVQTQQIQGNIIQVGAGHHIGNTLKRYGQGGVATVTNQQIKPASQGLIITQPQTQIITQKTGNLLTGVMQGPIYIAPKVQITETRTVNIDGITTTNKVQQQQDIFTYKQPKTPISGIVPQTNTQKVTEGLQKAIKDIQITHQKKDDLIQFLKQNIEITEDKNMTHSFGQRDNNYQTSEHLLSQDVRDLLKNYDSKGETYTSGYAVDSKYKTTQSKIEDPIVVFNTDPYHRVQTKGEIGASSYETYKQETVTYSKPSDDYEALKAKYDIKYDSKRQTAAVYDNNDYDFEKKYGEYKSDYRTQYKTDYKVNDLGQSKYRKDYASNDVEDPLIVYNTKKVDIGARDSLGYKSSNRGGDDYDEYRKKLKSSNGYDGGDRYESKYQSKYQTSNYRSNASGDYDNKYDSGYESKYGNRGNDKYGRQDRYERNNRQEDRYSSTRQPHRENRYQSERYEQSSKYERRSNAPKAQRNSNKYENGYQRRGNNKQSRNDKKNISYHDLRSLLYD